MGCISETSFCGKKCIHDWGWLNPPTTMSLYLSVIIESSAEEEILCPLKPRMGTSFLLQPDVMVVYVVMDIFSQAWAN